MKYKQFIWLLILSGLIYWQISSFIKIEDWSTYFSNNTKEGNEVKVILFLILDGLFLFVFIVIQIGFRGTFYDKKIRPNVKEFLNRKIFD